MTLETVGTVSISVIVITAIISVTVLKEVIHVTEVTTVSLGTVDRVKVNICK